jgi:hypothetical protein
MKERITAQLEAAANRIKELEEKLERLRGGECQPVTTASRVIELTYSYTTTNSNETAGPFARIQLQLVPLRQPDICLGIVFNTPYKLPSAHLSPIVSTYA